MGRHSFRYIQQIKQRRSLPWWVPSFSLQTISFKCPTQTFSASSFIKLGADYSFFVTWVIHKLCKLSMSHIELRNSCPKFTLPFEFPSLVNQLNIQTINLLDLSRNLDVTLLFPSLLIFIHPVGLCPMHFSLTLCLYHSPPLLSLRCFRSSLSGLYYNSGFLHGFSASNLTVLQLFSKLLLI